MHYVDGAKRAQGSKLEVVGTCDCVEREASLGPTLPRRLLLRNLWTAPEHRRRGVGSGLVQDACRLARSRGHTFVSLEVEAKNEGAAALYERLGFRDVDTSPKWVRAGLDLLGAGQPAALAGMKKALSVMRVMVKEV